MKLRTKVKLQPSPEQGTALLRTMERFNAACDAIAAVAFGERCVNKVELQKLVYRDTRQDFGLSAQMTIRAISKVVEAYKRNRSVKPTFRPHGAIAYDQRILSWKGIDRVSILTVDGRALMPFMVGAYHRHLADRPRGQADLVYRDGLFFLYVTVDVEEPEPFDPQGFLGVDLGVKNIAVDSDGKTFAGAQLNALRARHVLLRQKLQKKGTSSARRLLRRRRRKEALFSANVNHRIAKDIVRAARDTGRGIALEDLKGIRERTTVRKGQRRARHSWAFYQLRSMIEYKAKLAGVAVLAVDPRGTSTTCPCCGSVGRENRPTRDRFRCRHCGFSAPADILAANMIAGRAADLLGRADVMRPNATPRWGDSRGHLP